MESLRQPDEEALKKVAARMRHRGYTNILFDEVAAAFEKENPELKCVWEYAPPNTPSATEVMLRRMNGFRIVTMDEIPEGTPMPHTQESGEVRVADCILMCAPKDVYDAYYAKDFQEAAADANLPKEEYLESLKQKGTAGEHAGKAYGGITESTSLLEVDMKRATEGEENQ